MNTTLSAAATELENLRVRSIQRLVTPRQIKAEMPSTEVHHESVATAREEIRKLIHGHDTRLLVIVGPCSIHDPEAAIEYATRLNALRAQVSERLLLVMRVYFEKPRTRVGWKGLINDPHLDGTCDVPAGLAIARRLLLDVTSMGLPVATEFLDPIVPQYIADLVSWTAIGARTTESQTHREMASGLSMPVGFKNGTEGEIQTALDALCSAQSPHSFLGMDQDGQTAVVNTSGNPDCQLVLRGGRTGPNFSSDHVRAAAEMARAAEVNPGLMIDCSHANAGKDFQRQEVVWNDIVGQWREGSQSVRGAMIESNLKEGRQSMTGSREGLVCGVSITDGCVGWETTERMLLAAMD